MGTRSFGPAYGPGVRVEERGISGVILPSTLGTTAIFGQFERGRVHTAASPYYNYCGSLTSFAKQMGGRISESDAPLCGQQFFEQSQGAGAILAVRLTDGLEAKSESILYTRHLGTGFHAPTSTKDNQSQIRTQALKITSKNGGKWGGRYAFHRAEVALIGDIAETALTTGLTMLKDYWKGATLYLDGVPFRSYEVIGNTTAGVVTVKAGSTMSTDKGTSVDLDYTLILTPHTDAETGFSKGLRVQVTQAEESGAYFGLDVFLDSLLVARYTKLSMDPDSEFYVERIVNDDSSNYYFEVDDLLTTGIDRTSLDVMPANFYAQLKSLTTTKATFNAAQVASVSDSHVRVVGLTTPTDDLIPHRLTFTWDNVAHQYAVVATSAKWKSVALRNLPAFAVGAAVQYNKTCTAENDWTIGIVVDHDAEPALNSTIVIDVMPVTTDAIGDIFASTAPLRKMSIGLADEDSATVQAGDLTTILTPPTQASVTGTVDGPFAIVLGVNDALKFQIDKRTAVTVTLVADPAKTIGAVVTEINAAFDAVFGVGVVNSASAVGNKLKLTSAWYEGGGPGSCVDVQTVANHAYTTLGLTVAATYGTKGSEVMLSFLDPCVGGYDGDTPSDAKYIEALSIANCPLNWTLRKNYGVIQIAVPSMTTAAVQQAAIAYAERNSHFYHGAIPSTTLTENDAIVYVESTLGRSDFAGYYFPSFVYIMDPDKTSRRKLVHNVGLVAGRIARQARDARHFVQPAAGVNTKLLPVVALPTADNLDEGVLCDRGVNVVKYIYGAHVLWGVRTAYTTKTFKYLTHRLQVSQIEHMLLDNLDNILFRLNDPELWTELTTMIRDMLYPMFRDGAFEGKTFDDAITVKIDADNNPAEERTLGNLHADVGFVMKSPVERVIIGIYPTGVVERVA